MFYFCNETTLNYQKIENFINQNTFKNAAKATLNNANVPDLLLQIQNWVDTFKPTLNRTQQQQ